MKNTIKLLSVALLVTNVTQVFSAAGDDAKPRKRVPFNAATFWHMQKQYLQLQ